MKIWIDLQITGRMTLIVQAAFWDQVLPIFQCLHFLNRISLTFQFLLNELYLTFQFLLNGLYLTFQCY